MSSVLRLCPQCLKASHFSEPTWFAVCPHCGTELSSRLERRGSGRYKKQHPGILTRSGETYYGYTLDVSGTGARIIYTGGVHGKNTVFDLAVDSLGIRRQAAVVWATQKSQEAVQAGLRFL